jgi:fibronectin type 3 domain-containing protein
MKVLFRLGLLLCVAIGANAQQKPSVKLLAKAKKDTILLRWGPTDPLTWQYANKNGYQVERYTITRGKTLLAKPERVLLTPRPLKPEPKERWEENVAVNDYSAIAGEAIFSSSFEVSAPSQGPFEVINKVQELEQRFSFALLAADHSFATAKLSGLGYADVTAKRDEKYLYRVFVSAPDKKIKVDTAFYFISLNDTLRMPPPEGLQAEFRDKVVKLTWPKAFLQQAYTSFVIERADEQNKVYRRINSAAFINFDDPKELNYQYVDSLPVNGVKYSFRVRGITPFGEICDPSDPVSGAGYRNIMAYVSIKDVAEISPGKVQVDWAIEGDVSTVQGVFLQRAPRADGKFKNINRAKMPPDKKNLVDAEPLPTGYYRVKLTSPQDSVFSFPYLMQLLDSIPPLPPVGLAGKVDTTGIASLTWKANQENDLLGYRVFRSNFLNSEFSQLTKDPVETVAFTDTLEIRTMTKSVYYKIVAVDKRHNPSPYSQILKIEKPDILPPAQPSIKSIIQKGERIEIIWLPSPSEDVVKNMVIRKAKNATSWEEVKQLHKDSLSFNDPVQNRVGEFQYSIVAVDNAGNKSVPSPAFTLNIVSAQRKAVPDLSYSVDREAKTIQLKWKKAGSDIAKYLVFRAEDADALALYKSLEGVAEVFVDKNLTVNKVYKYRFKAVFTDGTESSFSKELNITF